MRTALPCLLLLAAGVAAQAQQGAAPTTQPHSVADLVALMKARQQDVDSAVLEMTTEGSYPQGMKFRIDGTVRVLHGTHMQVSTQAKFGEDFTAEMETVRTPQGVWIREQDPAQGEVYLHMDPDLVAKVQKATAKLGGDGQAPGGLPSQATDPLGAAMVQSLAEHFDLKLEQRAIEGQDFYVLKGDVRGDAPSEQGDEMDGEDFATPDRVEVLVRARDLAVTQMTQFRAGHELMKVSITKLVLNAPLEESSFEIDVPPGKHFVDVMDHPPSAAHINQLLSEAGMDEEATPPAGRQHR